MATPLPPSIPWTTRLTISPSPPPHALTGDKIHLPQSALEQLLSAAATIPQPTPDPNDPWAKPPPTRENLLADYHPLIVRLTHTESGKSAYAVPREFSAEEGEVVVSDYLRQVLGLEDHDDIQNGVLEIEAQNLQKGKMVRLRPLEAGYDDEDWKPILERYLREGFATVVEGMVLEVPRGRGGKKVWQFLVDKAEPSGKICVIDTDLEIDIEPLDEEQARETLRRRQLKKSSGGKVALENSVEGEVLPGEEHFYSLESWDHAKPLEIELDGIDLSEGDDVDLFITTDRLHCKPAVDEHIWGDMSSTFPKRIQVFPNNIELSDAKSLHICVRGWQDPEETGTMDTPTRRYSLFITQADITTEVVDLTVDDDEAPSSDHKRCNNCMQWIPSRTMFLHENFCLRNNVRCPDCNSIFKRGSEGDHWHCAHDSCSAYGNHPHSHLKHTATVHTPRTCPSCAYDASSLPALASHRTSTCPSKLILCGFCHLIVPQEGDDFPDAEQILSGLSRHEINCGGRTTECDLCGRRTRLRDLEMHLKNHDYQRLTKPLPKICCNPQCYRSPAENELGLCSVCFGPLYSSTCDPTGSGLRSRIERRFLRQLLQGCKNPYCNSELCKTGRKNTLGVEEQMGTKEAFPLVKAKPEGLMPFCVDETTSKRREMAVAISLESALQVDASKGGYPLEFCCKAIEASNGDYDATRRWLEREGVRTGER